MAVSTRYYGYGPRPYSSRFRLSLEDEHDARELALFNTTTARSRRRSSKGDNMNLLVVRHLVWQEREDREAREREQREREEAEAEEKRLARLRDLECPVHCLPEELLMSIFGLLELEELARSVVPVCSRWRRLGRDPSLWAQATLRYDPLSESPDDFIRALMTAPVLGAVEYIADGQAVREDVAEALAEGCPRVQSLTLLPWYLTDELLTDILERVSEHLEHLELFLPNLSVLDSISIMDSLHSLVLHGEISFVSDCLLKLAAGCRGLTSLDLGGLRFNDIHKLDSMIADVVRGHKDDLTVLKLPPSMTSSAVLDAVSECTQLQVLAIWITSHITSTRLGDALAGLERLRSLTWRNYDAWLDKAELAHFILHSDRFRALSEFRLVDCIDMDDGLALAIAHRCHGDGDHPGGLRSLSLHRSELSAHGLAEILSHARDLHTLDLYKNSNFKPEHLDMVPEHLPDLRLLDVRGCWSVRTVGPEVWEDLLEAMPALRIRFD